MTEIFGIFMEAEKRSKKRFLLELCLLFQPPEAKVLMDRDFYGSGKEIKEALPVGTVLTISAAGSEGSNGSVITNEENLLKWSASGDIIRPRFSILLTISAAGSEGSNGSVITNEENLLKWSASGDIIRPRFSILNPEFTCTQDGKTSWSQSECRFHLQKSALKKRISLKW